jgi:uncharacterized protein YndB with AHSA1/START domain
MAETFHSEIEIAAPRATVFAFLTDPDKILGWIGTEATVDARSRGIYLVNVGGKHRARGEFTEVVPVHRLAYTFGWEESVEVPPGSGLIEIDLIEKNEGTLLRFTHSGLPNKEQLDSHAKGWSHYLRRLRLVAAGADPGPDQMASAKC